MRRVALAAAVAVFAVSVVAALTVSAGAPAASAVRHQQFIDPPWGMTRHRYDLAQEAKILRTLQMPPLPTAAPSRPATPTNYTVVPGDTLSGIAQRFGVNIFNLAADNGLNLWDTLPVGKVLILPIPFEPPHTATPWVNPATTPARLVANHAPPAPVHVPVHNGPVDTGGWNSTYQCVIDHESGGNWAENTGNGYYGAAQWLPRTWNSAVSGAGHGDYANGRPDLDPPDVQMAAMVYWVHVAGWGQWPNTSRMCGV